MSSLQQQTVDLLGELIRFNTVNPPGKELPAQLFLKGYLEAAGFSCELLGASEGRPNLVARLDSGLPGPVLCYLSHIDTVLANPEEWAHDPFSGELVDGFVWGRGALDMKSQVAAEVVAAAELAHSGWRPTQGALTVVVCADEETGGSQGAQWLTENHPEKVRCDLLINEGGGAVFEYGGSRYYGLCCAEKGVARFTVRTRGRAGHASTPGLADNALFKLAPLIERFADSQTVFAPSDEGLGLLKGLGEHGSDLSAVLDRLAIQDSRLADLVGPMLGITFAPTRIRASEKINVIPSKAELKVDCRVPPGTGSAEVEPHVRELLGSGGYELDFGEEIVGNRSPFETSLSEAIAEWIGENDPGAQVVPFLLPGFTDSRWFRAAFPECVAYGFFPQRHMTIFDSAPLIHAADERIDSRDLGYAAEFFRWLAPKVLG